MLLRLRPKILAFVESLFSLAALALIVLFARRFSMQNVLGLAKKGWEHMIVEIYTMIAPPAQRK